MVPMPKPASANTQYNLPKPPQLTRLIGPSFIILGLGLGSGELILWPYLTSNYGLGMAWAIVVGVTIQFFINMEVSRYALIYGESIFVGFAKWLRWLPAWFIFSTFIGFGWPGIGLASANLFSHLAGAQDHQVTGIILFTLLGIILTIGKSLYSTVEKLQKTLISFGTPFMILLTLYLAKSVHWDALFKGLQGQGPSYFLLPAGVPMTTFLGALAFSGAGGNLNLAQSFYIRDKGYGMGKFAQKISSLFTKQGTSVIQLEGHTFPVTPANISTFRKWWHTTNLEHFLVFWVLGCVTMLTLSFLAFITTYGLPNNPEGINFILAESARIATVVGPLFGPLFLVISGCMLAATQLTVLDSTSRIITENILLLSRAKKARVSLVYYTILWVQIGFAIAIISAGFTQPRQLITISAALNGAAMLVYIALILYHHNTRLHPEFRPSLVRNILLTASLLFFTYFCFLSLKTL